MLEIVSGHTPETPDSGDGVHFLVLAIAAVSDPLVPVKVKISRLNQVAPPGYDPLGLNGSTIPARLEVGDYIAVHTYGWTEFQIDRATSGLRITTYGIQPYTRAEMEAAPQSVTSREPVVVSQFSVDAR